ncbi:MAG: hypothetical protein ACRDF0_08010 [Candidatus Limnocylindria bacterium]
MGIRARGGRAFARADGGQALIIVAAAMATLIAALALGIEWGHSLTMRRISQNEADSTGSQVGKYLATSVKERGFTVNRREVWCHARDYLRASGALTRTGATVVLSVAYSRDNRDWERETRANIAGSSCGSGGDIDDDTQYVRVRVEATYTSLIAGVVRGKLTAGSSAHLKLAGSEILKPLAATGGHGCGPGGDPPPCPAGIGLAGDPAGPHLWPLARHWDDFDDLDDPCGQFCDPNDDGNRPVRFWPPPSDQVFGGFKGLVDLSHESLRHADQTHQLATQADYSGSPHGGTAPVANAVASCGATFDTKGSGPVYGQSNSLGCNVPNWFHHGYQGGVGLGTNWADAGWNGFLGIGTATETERPSPLPASRESCDRPGYLAAPSCDADLSLIGDWAETAPGDMTAEMVAGMQDFIDRSGREVRYSSTLIGSWAPSDVRGRPFGKAVVVHVFLWDCAELYTADAPRGERWELLEGSGGDCSRVNSGSRFPGDVEEALGNLCDRLPEPAKPPFCDDLDDGGEGDGQSPGRVHLFAAVPFTFYEGLVTMSGGQPWVRAYWGDVFKAPGACEVDPSRCLPLNPLANTAFLVAEETPTEDDDDDDDDD